MRIRLGNHEVLLHPLGAAFVPETQILAVAVQADAVGQGGLFAGSDSLDLYLKLETLIGELNAQQVIFLVDGDPRLLPIQVLQLPRDCVVCSDHPGGQTFGTWDSVSFGNLRFCVRPKGIAAPGFAIGGYRPNDDLSKPGERHFARVGETLLLPFLVGANEREPHGDLEFFTVSTPVVAQLM
jgi:hypothetical protein